MKDFLEVEPSSKYSYIRHVHIITQALFTIVGLYYIAKHIILSTRGLERLGP
jgi:hypothetical protein